ncbi:DUF411 domain-containing protein [Microbulbifer rhizosphaerae]|uniref:Metal-binding protein n=1 Tax=Microbulbifer rhizosphaerae TaxID=1562603 RepID=A0A7W4WGI5_9GAMM|nr:DUF411 domain-containing protein [Microbulbifer rhizosphaerae]MBB3063263.1 hypothetical protein [Microbulbifer rhizosphaerae]
MNRKLFAACLGGLTLLALSACAKDNSADNTAAVELTTYKSATCGCCKLWVKHAEDLGFAVTARDVDDLGAVKNRHGIDPQFQSCHTSVTGDGYVFEGHIPAKLIRRFLQNPPVGARGLAVPAMPLGSPGMEYKDKFTPYQVWQLNRDGSREVYTEITTAAEQF